MKLRAKIFVTVVGFFAQLFFVTPIHSDIIQTNDRTAEEIFGALATGQHSRTLVSLSPLVVEGRTLGQVLVYDDPATKRPVDYFELYDSTGDLVAVGWFDQFGIQRVAVDRGLLETGDKVEGIYVFFLEGDSI